MSANVGDLLRRAHGLWAYIDEGGEGAKRLRELERELIEAQQRETALSQANAALKQTIADYEQFDIERKYYTRKQKPSGAWVVHVRPGKEVEADVEQGMEFCVNCFQKRKLSILQPAEKRGSAVIHITCQECGANIMQDKPPTGFAEFC